MRILGLAVFVAALHATTGHFALAQEAAAKDVPEDLRGTRYCEIIPVYRDGISFNLEVYNTLGQNDCPPAVWDAIDPKALARELGAEEVVMNGPRFWVMDRIIGSGETMDGETKVFDGLAATQRATLSLPFRDIIFGSRPYSEKTINRDTTYIYDAGKPVYEISDDKGNVYVMQTFAEIVDKDLAMDDLAGLGERLELPRGWSYASRVLDAEMQLIARGEAYLIQDELQNSYQRRN
jgi:hypothetical protein